MGEAKLRRVRIERERQEDERTVFVDLSGPLFVPLRNDAESQAHGPDGSLRTADEVKAICMRSTIIHAVVMRYQQGIGREDGRAWARWQTLLDRNIVFELPQGVVLWLLRLLESEDTVTAPPFSMYREALIVYLRELTTDKPEAVPVS